MNLMICSICGKAVPFKHIAKQSQWGAVCMKCGDTATLTAIQAALSEKSKTAPFNIFEYNPPKPPPEIEQGITHLANLAALAHLAAEASAPIILPYCLSDLFKGSDNPFRL
jgi:hypothetical protein